MELLFWGVEEGGGGRTCAFRRVFGLCSSFCIKEDAERALCSVVNYGDNSWLVGFWLWAMLLSLLQRTCTYYTAG